MSKKYEDNDEIVTMINNGWNKLQEYYKLLDVSPIHFASISLHPEMKWKHFEIEWETRPEWITAGKAQTRQLWESKYKHMEVPLEFLPKQLASNANRELEEPEDSDSDEDGGWRGRQRKRARLNAPEFQGDSLEHFQLLPVETLADGWDVFKYWTWKLKNPSENIETKRLALMALDVLSPPPMSDEPERVFSSASATEGKRRTTLDPTSLEAIECLKAWSKAGLGTFIEGTNDVTLQQLESFLRELDKGTASSIEKYASNETASNEAESLLA